MNVLIVGYGKMGRLIDALKSPESRERFQNEGFRWKGPSER